MEIRMIISTWDGAVGLLAGVPGITHGIAHIRIGDGVGDIQDVITHIMILITMDIARDTTTHHIMVDLDTTIIVLMEEVEVMLIEDPAATVMQIVPVRHQVEVVMLTLPVEAAEAVLQAEVRMTPEQQEPLHLQEEAALLQVLVQREVENIPMMQQPEKLFIMEDLLL